LLFFIGIISLLDFCSHADEFSGSLAKKPLSQKFSCRKDVLQAPLPASTERVELRLRQAECGEPQLRFEFSRDAFDGQPQQSIVVWFRS
jgi:hypothetical protein